MSVFESGSAEEMLSVINAPHQFAYENGITITQLEPGLARGELRAGTDSVNPHGQVHGGALYTLADTVAGCCACSKGGSCVTSGSSMEFLRPVYRGRIVCTATPKKLGRSLSVIQVELKNEENVVAATGTFTFFMLK